MPFAPKHGQSYPKTKTYTTWVNLKQRCYNKNHAAYHNYGGRSIAICKRWQGVKGFEHFLADMGEAPPGMQIERKNNNGNYEPANCIWATRTQQARNMRTNVLDKRTADAIRRAYIPRVVPQWLLAKRFGVSQMTVSLVIQGKIWK